MDTMTPAADSLSLGRALRKACQKNDTVAALALIDMGAPVAEPIARGRRATALGWACVNGNAKLAKALCKAGADPWMAARDNYVDAWHACVSMGHVEVLAAMGEVLPKELATGAWPCPLSHAAMRAYPEAHRRPPRLAESVKELALHCPVGVFDRGGFTPLMHAVRGGAPEVVDALLDAGADVDQAGKTGVTALMLSSKNGASVARLLLARGADPLRVDEVQATALHWAAKRGDPDALALLSDSPAIAMRDFEGQTPLQRAIHFKQASAESIALLEGAELGWIAQAEPKTMKSRASL